MREGLKHCATAFWLILLLGLCCSRFVRDEKHIGLGLTTTTTEEDESTAIENDDVTASTRRVGTPSRAQAYKARRDELLTDREHLFNILKSAGVDSLTNDDIEVLPTWTQVSSLYGSEPVIYGLETCETYRTTLQQYIKNSNTTDYQPAPRVAGLFNTGTNAVSQSMSMNFIMMDDYMVYNLFWGKHVPPRDIWTRPYPKDRIETTLPIVLVRDPMYWMQSMCKAPYNAKWDKGTNRRCPNLIPTSKEQHQLAKFNTSSYSNNSSFHTFPVDVVVRGKYRDHYESLAGLWSEWNRLWLEYKLPRLMIRFEDFLFHGETIMKTISECSGISMQPTFSYLLQASKEHGHSSDFFGALVKYGSGQGRLVNFTSAEQDYLQSGALDPNLMHLFQYRSLSQEEPTSG